MSCDGVGLSRGVELRGCLTLSGAKQRSLRDGTEAGRSPLALLG